MHANMLQFDDVSMHAETSGAYNKQQYAKVWTISGPSISITTCKDMQQSTIYPNHTIPAGTYS